MRVVADTNVFVSAAIKLQSVPAFALTIVHSRGTLLKSSTTAAQLTEVLNRPRLSRYLAPAAEATIMVWLAAAETIDIVEHVAVCRDPTDDKFLDVAINGRADFVVTGDNDLLVLEAFRGIPILTPAAFVLRVQQ